MLAANQHELALRCACPYSSFDEADCYRDPTRKAHTTGIGGVAARK
jgi:hypothetical protein